MYLPFFEPKMVDNHRHHSYGCLGVHPSLLFSLPSHSEQRMTHSGRGYLQLELISVADSPWNPFLVFSAENSITTCDSYFLKYV